MNYNNIIKNSHTNEEQAVLIASHRGKFGSSVMENTTLAFELALYQGADMVEMDLDMTKDGIIIGHHDDTMTRLFHKNKKICEYTYQELINLPIYNIFGEPCAETISTFEEILSALKDRTLLVLDKCWEHWDAIATVIKKYSMEKQIIMKFYIEDQKAISWTIKHPQFMYIPMVQNPNDKSKVYQLQNQTNVIGIEILPENPNDIFLQEDYITELHSHNLLIWCNSLSLSKNLTYGGGFDDLKSLHMGGDYGWGELIKRKIDIIQTDWVYELKNYLKSSSNLL